MLGNPARSRSHSPQPPTQYPPPPAPYAQQAPFPQGSGQQIVAPTTSAQYGSPQPSFFRVQQPPGIVPFPQQPPTPIPAYSLQPPPMSSVSPSPQQAGLVSVPMPYQLALYPQHVTQAATILTFKDDKFRVTCNGQEVLRVKDRSDESKMDINDTRGFRLFKMKQHSFSKNRWTFETDQGVTILVIPRAKGNAQQALFTSVPSGEQVNLSMQSGGAKGGMLIQKDGQEIVRADVEKHMFRANEFTIRVNAGVDLSLAVGLVMALSLDKSSAKQLEAVGSALDGLGAVADGGGGGGGGDGGGGGGGA